MLRIIGEYLGSYPTEEEFLRLVKLKAIYYEFRPPVYNGEICNRIYSEVNNWHRDCGGNRHHMAIWSNREQSELREIRSHLVLDPLPSGKIILFNNFLYEHRTPRTMTADRTFVRCYIDDNVIVEAIASGAL